MLDLVLNKNIDRLDRNFAKIFSTVLRSNISIHVLPISGENIVIRFIKIIVDSHFSNHAILGKASHIDRHSFQLTVSPPQSSSNGSHKVSSTTTKSGSSSSLSNSRKSSRKRRKLSGMKRIAATTRERSRIEHLNCAFITVTVIW